MAKRSNRKLADDLRKRMEHVKLQRKMVVLDAVHRIAGKKMKIKFAVRKHDIQTLNKLSELLDYGVNPELETRRLVNKLIEKRKPSSKLTEKDVADASKLLDMLKIWESYYLKFVESYEELAKIDKALKDEMDKLGKVEIPSWVKEHIKGDPALAEIKTRTVKNG